MSASADQEESPPLLNRAAVIQVVAVFLLLTVCCFGSVVAISECAPILQAFYSAARALVNCAPAWSGRRAAKNAQPVGPAAEPDMHEAVKGRRTSEGRAGDAQRGRASRSGSSPGVLNVWPGVRRSGGSFSRLPTADDEYGMEDDDGAPSSIDAGGATACDGTLAVFDAEQQHRKSGSSGANGNAAVWFGGQRAMKLEGRAGRPQGE